MNSKGVLGSLMTTFVATVIVIILLLIFVFISGAVRVIEGESEGVAVHDEKKVDVEDIGDYMGDSFAEVVEKRFLEVKGGGNG